MNEILLTNNSNSCVFEEIYKYLKNDLNIEFTNIIDGLDQSYYDFIFENNKLCLHREHYLGIMIYSEKNSEIKLIENLVKNIKENIKL